MKKIILLLILGCLSLPLFSQSISTQGKEFWLSFMHNGYYDRDDKQGVTNQLIISSKYNCSGTISNPSTNWSQSFNVQANSIYTLNVPEAQCYHDGNNHETVSTKGLHIVADTTISVYFANIADYSFDASFVLPIEGLGNDYIIQCGEQSTLENVQEYKLLNQTSAFLIVATQDNTLVDITPTVATLGGHAAEQAFSVTLNAGQTYQVRSLREGNNRDLSGTRVTAHDCKRIAVFNGNTITRVPVDLINSSGYDHVFEQAMPVRSWGKQFVVTQSLTRNRDYVKIVSASNGNEIRKNGAYMTTLDANESYGFYLNSQERSCYIEASQICAVYLYNTSADDDRANGDPSMVWIAPVEQKIDEVTFATFSGSSGNTQIDNHYMNIIVSKDDISRVFLDGAPLPSSEFSPVTGNPDYYFARKSIYSNSHPSSHRLSCVNGFNAHLYGFGNARGYAYLVGSNAIDLSTNLVIDDATVSEGDVLDYCLGDVITFGAVINYENYDLEWNFGDGQTSHADQISHAYVTDGLFAVSLIVTTDETGCQATASDTIRFFINVHATEYSSIIDNICWNGHPGIYNEHGFTIEYNQPDTYTAQYDTVTQYGCDSVVSLTLFVIEPADTIWYKIDTCYTDSMSYTWPVNGQTYHQSTSVTYTDTSSDCDRTFRLILKFHKNYYHEEEYEEVCDSYTWWATGETVTEIGTYNFYKNFHGGGGPDFDCDSVYTKTVTIIGHSIDTSIRISDTCGNVYVTPWEGHEPVPFYNDTIQTFIEDWGGCYRKCTVIIENLRYEPHPFIESDDPNPHYPITATEFNVNRYTYTVKDTISDNSTWYKDLCEWHITKPSWPIVVSEDKLTCTVYAMDWTTDSINLSFKAFNDCSGEEGKMAEFWLYPSFYGVDETDSFHADFSIVPNPNNGEMELQFKHLTDKVNVKVYDTRGLLIDQFDFYNTLENNTIPYNFNPASSGIYYFVATAREGTVAQKAAIVKP